MKTGPREGLGRPDIYKTAVVEKRDAVGESLSEMQEVGNHHDAQAAALIKAANMQNDSLPRRVDPATPGRASGC
jgi:hypothetical protein